MPSASEITATVVTNGALSSVRIASFRLNMEYQTQRWGWWFMEVGVPRFLEGGVPSAGAKCRCQVPGGKCRAPPGTSHPAPGTSGSLRTGRADLLDRLRLHVRLALAH